MIGGKIDNVEIVATDFAQRFEIGCEFVAREGFEILRLQGLLDLARGDLIGFELRFANEFGSEYAVLDPAPEEKEEDDQDEAGGAPGKNQKVEREPIWQAEQPHEREVEDVSLKNDGDISDDAFGGGHFAGPVVGGVVQRAAEEASRFVESSRPEQKRHWRKSSKKKSWRE